MPEYKYKHDALNILAETDGGLKIILSYYPQASNCVHKKNEKFKIREEKTPSATLKQLDDGNWVVTDWGDDGISRNGIQVIQKEEGVEFKEALQIAAEQFGIISEPGTQSKLGADFEEREAKPNEHEGDYSFDYLEEYPEVWLSILGPYVKDKHCKYLHVKPIKSFTYIKKGQALITISREDYPIFTIEEEGFKKIYQPKNPDKKYRFRYVGTKQKDFIHGLEQAIHKYNQLNELKDLDQEGNEDLKEKKLPELIICSGDRDAINVCSLGYNVVWLNSESADLKGEQFKKMCNIAEGVYNIPDIDHTGKKQGAKLALKYLTIKTIWLPDWLGKLYDFRGNSQKDVTDYVNHQSFTKNKFKKLYDNALAAQFWNEQAKMNKTTGEFIKMEFFFSHVHAYYFLNLNGFYRFENKNYKSGYMFIHILENVVREVDPIQIKAFVNAFLEERQLPIDLRNMIYRTTQLSDLSLANLNTIEIDFTDFDAHTQYMFFENATWQISGDKITQHKPGATDKFVWEDEVLPHRVKLSEAPFDVSKHLMEDGHIEYDIEIKKNDCLFLKYLINTSRVHWQKELEERLDTKPVEEQHTYQEENKWSITGNLLSDEEQYEQKLHLVNKIYAIGYLMHRHKNPAKPWMVFAMDNKISEEGESHGGSGKSICFGSLKKMMKSVTKNGRDTKLFDNNHWSDGITEHTDYVYIDDIDKYFKLHYLFAPISGDWEVNPKNNKQYIIPYENSPKICGSSNYTPRNIDPSLQRRLLFTVFSDYYHYNKHDEYIRNWDPQKEFGKNLFSDFDDKEWNSYHNTIAWCIKTYLQLNEKVDPPMDNVNKRNLIAEMTEVFKAWADIYFSDESRNLDRNVDKHQAMEDFKTTSKMMKWTPNRFTKSLRAWCRYYKYIYNPKELTNDQEGRIIGKKEGKSHEYLFIKTSEVAGFSGSDDEGELPF